ncbi:MAG: hypothetical protein ACOC3G_08315, partial [Phycisphaeraceae bacterium]
VTVVPGVELSTEQAGLEILAYFPDAGKLFTFLSTTRGVKFKAALTRRQDAVHAATLTCLDRVNRWLKKQKVPDDQLITVEEVDRWYRGQKPYFPGTLCVLGLKRLSRPQREQLGIHDPREFNTKVVTPVLRKLDMKVDGGSKRKKTPLEENFALVRSAARGGLPVVSMLAHPRELVTKGKVSLGAVRKLIFRLAEEYGLDGVEVASSRDGAEDVRYWREIVADYNASVAAGERPRGAKPLLESSYASDFHVLAPGLATGEITLGFGLLDSRPRFRRGNLRPQMPIADFFEALRRRAGENAGQ